VKVLRRRDTRALWLAGLVSETGDWLLLIALPIVVYQLTGSTLGTALAFLVELAPPIVLGPLAGRLADRWDQRRALRAICAAQAVALLPLLLVHHRSGLWIVYAVITVQAALATLFDPSRNALLPALVPADELVEANSLFSLTANIGRLGGGPLGGLLLAFGGLTTIVAADAVSFALAALLLTGVRTRSGPVRPAAGPGVAPRIPAAARRPIRATLSMAAIGAVAQGLFAVLFVPFVARALAGDAAETGLLRGVQAVGAIAAGLLLATVARRWRPAALAVGGAALFGLLDLALWNAPRLTTAEPLYVVLFAAVGAPGTAMVTGLVSTLQQAAPAGTAGRVFGAFNTTFAAGQAVGMVAGGVLGDRLGVVAVLNAQGCLYLLAAATGAVTLLAWGAAAPVREWSPG
jgi:MFS family permease